MKPGFWRSTPLQLEPLRRLTLQSASAPGRPRYLSAASGLVRTGDELCVVADDELHLGRFGLAADRPGRLLRLLPGKLPAGARPRKRRKPDLEVLLRLPAAPGLPHGALLALGSGSRPRRRAGALLPLRADGRVTHRPRPVDAAPLFARLTREFDDLNIEGGWTDGQTLFLLQRGNKGNSPNALIGVALERLLHTLVHEQVLADAAPRLLREIPLGDIDGIPVSLTDGVPLPDGRWLFSAVAEDSTDAFHDGAFAGAFVGMAGVRHGVQWLRPVAPAFKLEGIEIAASRGRQRILLVSDADDVTQPAWLLAAHS